jgi:hypothetical protein
MFNYKNKKIILSLILIVFYSLSTFAQPQPIENEPIDWTPPPDNPGSPNNSSDPVGTPVGTPIDDNILALLVLGLGLGVFKIHTKKDKIIHKVE